MDLLPVLRAATAGGQRRTSVDKVRALLEGLSRVRPTGAMAAVCTLVLPNLMRHVQLPEDPAELDALLDQLAQLITSLKSDPEEASHATPDAS